MSAPHVSAPPSGAAVLCRAGVVRRANIANDECDFGASLQLGQDVFNHSLSYAPLAARTLATAYSLLGRDAYAEITKLHGPHRAHS